MKYLHILLKLLAYCRDIILLVMLSRLILLENIPAASILEILGMLIVLLPTYIPANDDLE